MDAENNMKILWTKKKEVEEVSSAAAAMMMSRHQRKWAHTFAWPKNNNYTLGLLTDHIGSAQQSLYFMMEFRSSHDNSKMIILKLVNIG